MHARFSIILKVMLPKRIRLGTYDHSLLLKDST